ncbi:patatin-like phospholipase family protein [soil metagenome]
MKPSRWTRRFRRAAPPPAGVRADPAGLGPVRFIDDDADDGLVRLFGDLAASATADPREGLKVLALSGGGAGGAFGAGALVGLTGAGTRPVFDVVTGVSTGALIAPFAFLGSDWDDRLRDAYCGGQASDLLGLTGLRPGLSLFGGEALTSLVKRYVDETILDAVRDAHRTGRRLFVATANLDTESTSIWDMGAIAGRGGPAALSLFIDVLVASASLPGLFPPRMIGVESGNLVFEEMHVDGGTISPLFVVPEPFLLSSAREWTASRIEIYALVNTTLGARRLPMPMSGVPILVRSFEMMLRSSYRTALRSVAAFCEINGFVLRTASIPASARMGSMLDFEASTMTAMFECGERLAQTATLWSTAATTLGGHA